MTPPPASTATDGKAIQRLLRGKALYVVLTCVVLGMFLYGRAVRIGSWLPSQPSSPETESLAEEWWTEDVDRAALTQAASNNPVQGFVLMGVLSVIAGMFCGGILLTTWAIVTGRVRTLWRGPSHRPPPWTMAECWRIILLLLLMGCLLQFVRISLYIGWPGWWVDANLWTNVSMLMLHGVLLLTIVAFAMGKTIPASQALGLATARWREAISLGVRGYIAVFPWLLLLLVAVVRIADAMRFEPPVQPIHDMLFAEQRAPVLGLTVLLSCVVGPIAEEVFFRGVLFAAIRKRFSRGVAMGISGAVFSMVHTNLIGFIPILLLGCLLADLYERTGSLLSPIAVHMLHNSLLLSVALTYRWIIG